MIRLYVEQDLAAGNSVLLDEKQSHYLMHVMRQKDGDTLLAFNGRDGEWRAKVSAQKKTATLKIATQSRPQQAAADIWLCFAPIKKADYTVEKATELGVAKLLPVITQRTIVARVNLERYRAITIEAAEQCERLTLPEITEPQKLDALLAGWDAKRRLLLCAEEGQARPIAAVLSMLPSGPLAVLTGPEGGFTENEFQALRKREFVTPVSLGPRILRADTAALAALSLVQAHKGDWTEARATLG